MVVRQGVGMVYGGGEWCMDVWNGAGMDGSCGKRWEKLLEWVVAAARRGLG